MRMVCVLVALLRAATLLRVHLGMRDRKAALLELLLEFVEARQQQVAQVRVARAWHAVVGEHRVRRDHRAVFDRHAGADVDVRVELAEVADRGPTGDVGLLAGGALHARDQHVLGEPAFFLRHHRGDA